MSLKKCIDFLIAIFWQAYHNENFFLEIKKAGVRFSSYPNYSEFEKFKKFEQLASEKSHTVAMFEMDLKVPENSFSQIVSIDEVKIFYRDYLNFVRGHELGKALSLNPDKANELCQKYLDDAAPSTKTFSIFEAVNKFCDEQKKLIEQGKQNISIPGFEETSKIISGFNPGRVTIFTAHSGFGKSNLAINILRNAQVAKLKTIYINMEMDLNDLTKRYLQTTYSMRQYDFKDKSFEQKIVNPASPWLQDGQDCFFTDGDSLSFSEIKNIVLDHKKRDGVDLVLVDYDQKILDEENTKDEWRFIQKSVERLERLAKQANVHVIMFSQTDEDGNGRPRASKRAIQPAASVIYFHKNPENQEETIFSFLKNRFGPTDKKIRIKYDAEKSKIREDDVQFVTSQKIEKPNNSYGFKYE